MPHHHRRAFLKALSLSGFALTGAGVLSGTVRAQAQQAGLIAPNVCLVSPEVTEGPYYIDPGLNSQIFFPDALSEYLFRNVSPYDLRTANRDTTNSNDGIAAQAGDGAYALIREQSRRYEAAMVVGINKDAQAADAPLGPVGPPPGVAGRFVGDGVPRGPGQYS